jgi:hypothetical protein
VQAATWQAWATLGPEPSAVVARLAKSLKPVSDYWLLVSEILPDFPLIHRHPRINEHLSCCCSPLSAPLPGWRENSQNTVAESFHATTATSARRLAETVSRIEQLCQIPRRRSPSIRNMRPGASSRGPGNRECACQASSLNFFVPPAGFIRGFKKDCFGRQAIHCHELG